MDKVVRDLAKKVAERYGNALSQFRPCKPGGELLEQNLITLLSHEFMFMFKDDTSCIAYSEIPFKSEKHPDTEKHPDNWSNRLDGFLANKDMAFLVEAKNGGAESGLLSGIREDLRRIHLKELEASFKEMSSHGDRQYVLPPAIFGLIIAGYWIKTDSKPWFTSEEDLEAKLASKLPEHPVTSKIIRVGTYGVESEMWDFYIVVAQTAKLNWNSDTLQ